MRRISLITSCLVAASLLFACSSDSSELTHTPPQTEKAKQELGIGATELSFKEFTDKLRLDDKGETGYYMIIDKSVDFDRDKKIDESYYDNYKKILEKVANDKSIKIYYTIKTDEVKEKYKDFNQEKDEYTTNINRNILNSNGFSDEIFYFNKDYDEITRPRGRYGFSPSDNEQKNYKHGLDQIDSIVEKFNEK